MARRNESKLMPLSGDDKVELLRKLQGSPHFEKILTATSSSLYRGKTCKLILPASFVEQHGDKFRQSALLRSGSSTKVSWPVTLTIQVLSPNCTSVSFSGGWRAFATANGLLEGDSLVFALTAAMSEFEVYLFRKNGNIENARQDLGSLHMDTRRYNSPLPGFFKKLTTTNVSDGVGCLEIPLEFWKVHSSRIHSEVKLQGIHEHSPVQTMTCCATHGQPVRHFWRAEWRAFVTENHLQVGQELLFTLVADSYFLVREFALQQAPP